MIEIIHRSMIAFRGAITVTPRCGPQLALNDYDYNRYKTGWGGLPPQQRVASFHRQGNRATSLDTQLLAVDSVTKALQRSYFFFVAVFFVAAFFFAAAIDVLTPFPCRGLLVGHATTTPTADFSHAQAPRAF